MLFSTGTNVSENMTKYFGYFLLILCFADAQHNPCYLSVSVDITNGTRQRNGNIWKDGVRYDPSNYYEQDDVVFGCPCNLKKCIRKCCAVDEIVVNKTCTKSDHRVLIPIHTDTDFQHHLDMKNETHKNLDFFYIHSRCNRSIRLEPEEEPTDVFFIQANGTLFAPNAGLDGLLGPHGYCVDVFDDTSMDKTFTALLCDDEMTTEEAIHIISIRFNSSDCSKPIEYGPHVCLADYPVYHWNGKTCEEATYGGCNATPNNFRTFETCMAVAAPICSYVLQ